jgi:hypothetical protein
MSSPPYFYRWALAFVFDFLETLEEELFELFDMTDLVS